MLFSFEQPTQLQFYSFSPSLYFTGGPAYLHLRKEIFVRNVRGLLCTSRPVCKVMLLSLIGASNYVTQIFKYIQKSEHISLTRSCDFHQYRWAAGAPGAHGECGKVVPVSFPCREERFSGQETLQPHPGRSLLLPLGSALWNRRASPAHGETTCLCNCYCFLTTYYYVIKLLWME